MELRLGTNLDVAGKMTIDLIFQGRKRNVNGKGTARRERRAGSKGQDTKANNKNKVRRNKKREKTETQEKYITKIEEARQQIVQQTKGAKVEGERGVARREREGEGEREAVTISAHLKVSNILFIRFGPRPTNTLFFVTKLSRKL